MIGSGYNSPETPAGPRVRIYELAKELALGHREMVAKVRSLGIEVANHMSHLEPMDVDRVRRAVDRERKESTVEERITADGTVIRRRSKSVAVPPIQPALAPATPAPVAAKAASAPVIVEAPADEAPPRPVAPPAPKETVEAAPEAAEEAAAAPAPNVVEPPTGAAPGPVLRTIPQPVVTGSAAT